MPAVADTVDVATGAYTNEHGAVREAWFHLFGCRRWVTLWRDTRTDEWVDPPS